MTLNTSGPISLAGTVAGVSIEIENGGTGTSMISLNDAAVRSLANVPSGQISMPSDFYGKSNVIAGTWVARTNKPFTVANNGLLKGAIGYGNGRWAMVSSGGTASTNLLCVSDDDGVNWTSLSLPGGANSSTYGFTSIAYGNGTWVIVGKVNFSLSQTEIYYSTDNMASWGLVAISSSVFNFNYRIKQVIFANGYFLAFTDYGAPGVLFRSTDGINWTKITSIPNKVSFACSNGSGSILALSGSNFYDIYYSTDNGTNWSTSTYVGSGGTTWGVCTFGNGYWTADNFSGTGYTVKMSRSSSVSGPWPSTPNYTNSTFTEAPMVYCKGKFLVPNGQYGSWQSTDAINWTQNPSSIDTTSRIISTYSNGTKAMGIGYYGQVYFAQ